MCCPVNGIGAKGASALSEAMKTNTTLQSLKLGCEQEESDEDGWIVDIATNQHQQAGNGIGAEGASELSEALKTNTTLYALNLFCEQEESVEDGWILDIANNQHQQAVNNIGAEGTRALSEALKTNTTLYALNLHRVQRVWIMDELEALPAQQQQAVNGIDEKGSRALSEALKKNTTLKLLNLASEQEESDEDGWIADIANNQHKQAANNIGPEGARALSDALKTNTTLIALDLGCEKKCAKWMNWRRCQQQIPTSRQCD